MFKQPPSAFEELLARDTASPTLKVNWRDETKHFSVHDVMKNVSAAVN
jgi:hypothetical protein